MNIEPLEVILDAEVLKRDPSRSKGPFRALTHLSQSGNVRVHIPEVAVQEFLTDQRSKVRSSIDKCKGALNELLRFPLPPDTRSLIETSRRSLSDMELPTYRMIEESFERWCRDNDVVIEIVKDNYAREMFNSYFMGRPPFKTVKNREDIPDAFIWLSVCEICREASNAAFVTGDKNLRSACSKGPENLSAYDSIESFLEASGLIGVLRHSILETQFEKLFTAFFELQDKTPINRLLEEQLLGRNIAVHYPVAGVYRVQSLKEIKRIFFEDDGIYYGDGLLAIRFSARALCDLTNATQKHELKITGDIEKTVLTALENDIVEICVSRTIVFAASLLLGFDKSLLEEERPFSQVREAVKSAEIVLEYLSVHGERDSKVTVDIFNQHARDEAEAQIDSGNLDIEVDAAEEQNRVSMARWFDVPEELIGEHGEIIIEKGAKVKIAPIPRFEEWVKIIKKGLLESRENMDLSL